jgi:exonuclease III
VELEEKISLIQIYAPTQDSEEIEKDIFYNLLQQMVEKAREYARHVVVMRDWNARIGDQIDRRCGTIAQYPAESIYNGNGDKIINVCIDNDILIGNTFLPHKKVQKITFEAERGGASSTIDYITYSQTVRYAVNDVRVYRSAELNTENKLLIIRLRLKPLKLRWKKPYTKIKIQWNL